MKIKRCILGIPARLKSSRLPNKILADINGKPMLKRVLERCHKVKNAYGVVVCTEDRKVYDFVKECGWDCLLTSNNFSSGSERLASVTDKLVSICWGDEYKSWPENIKLKAFNETGIINIQGDQPFIDPNVITKLINIFSQNENPPDVITPIYKLKRESIHDPSVVKTLITREGKAIYFSRTALPHIRDIPAQQWFRHTNYWGHVGIYGYKSKILSNWDSIPNSRLESLEKLEQLRIIEAGYDFSTFKIEGTSLSVDNQDQLKLARQIALEID